MADMINAEVAGNVARQTASGAAIVITYLFLGLAVAGLIWFVWWVMSYRKLRVVIFEATSTGVVLRTEDKAKLVVRNGVKKWRLLKQRIEMTLPPSKATYTDEKGRKKAVAFIKDGTIMWPDSVKLDFDDDGYLKVLGFGLYAEEDKAALAQEVVAANSFRRKSWGEMLERLVFPIAMVLLVAMVLIFIGGPMEKINEAQSTNLQILEKQEVIINKYDALLNDRLNVDSSDDGVVRGEAPN